MITKKTILSRFTGIYRLLILFGLILLGKVLYLQLVEGEYWRGKAQAVTYRTSTVFARRGNILSSDGQLLASSVPYFNVRFDPLADGITGKNNEVYTQNIDSLAYCLSNLFRDKSANEYKRVINQARTDRNRYFLVKRRIDFLQLSKLKTFPIFRRGKSCGLIIETINERIYPFGELAYRMLGNTKADTTVGVEGAFNNYLRGKNGEELQLKISSGWMPVPGADAVSPEDGCDVVTTLDIRMQDIAQNALKNRLLALDADHGSIIVMETSTGDIKAMSSLVKADGSYHERLNYAIGEAVEPGSTFKLYSYMSLLEDGLIKLEDSIDNGNGYWKYSVKTFHDDGRPSAMGKLTIEQAFAQSSNISIAKLVVEHYKGDEAKFMKRIESLHLNKPFGLQISGEANTFFQDPSTKNKSLGWSNLSLPQISTGYEVRLAPIHTVTLYNAIANNGKMVKPRFVKEVIKNGQTIESYPVEVLVSRICSNETLSRLRTMLEAVVEYGTAKGIKSEVYPIAGKTGTAQIAAGNTGYGASKSHYASFVGYFPADKPKYTCIVTISRPKGQTGGGTASAPVFKEVSDRIYALLMTEHPIRISAQDTINMPILKSGDYESIRRVVRTLDIPIKSDRNLGDWVNTDLDNNTIVISNREIIDNLVPNVKDMGLKDAVFLLESSGMRVQVKGEGRVRRQSLVPGQKVVKGQTIIIELG